MIARHPALQPRGAGAARPRRRRARRSASTSTRSGYSRDVRRRLPGADGVGAVVVARGAHARVPGALLRALHGTTTRCCSVERAPGVARGARRLVELRARRCSAAWNVAGAHVARPCSRVRRGTRRRRRGRQPRPAASASTRSCSPATATRRCACWPTPTTGRARRARRDSATRRTRPCCTPTPRCCRATAAPGRRGTPTCRRDPDARVHGQLQHEPAAVAAIAPNRSASRSTAARRSTRRRILARMRYAPSALHARARRRAGAPRRDQRRRAHLVRRRLLALRLPRGRHAQRRRRGPRTGRALGGRGTWRPKREPTGSPHERALASAVYEGG